MDNLFIAWLLTTFVKLRDLMSDGEQLYGSAGIQMFPNIFTAVAGVLAILGEHQWRGGSFFLFLFPPITNIANTKKRR